LPVSELKKRIVFDLDYQKNILTDFLVTVLSSRVKKVMLPDIRKRFPDADMDLVHEKALFELKKEGYIVIGDITNFSYMIKLVE
jgi:hypothetical protein